MKSAFLLMLVLLSIIAQAQAGILPTWTDDSFQIYLAPDGSDTNAGSSTAPLKTLAAAQTLLKRVNPQKNVVISIAPGTYYDQRVAWTFVRPNYNIAIRGAGSVKPIFDGCQSGATDIKTQCNGGTFFTLSATSGTASNLELSNLQVQNYWMAISLNGIYTNFGAFNWNNKVLNNSFVNIGNGWNPSLPYSYAAVRLYNSRNNSIIGNNFQNIVNLGDYDGYIHAIYLASYSSANTITNNWFQNVSGDVIRIRDTSNYNYIANNNFSKAGKFSVSSDWYCAGSACEKLECPSWNNFVAYNNYGLSFASAKIGATQAFDTRPVQGCAAPDLTSTRFKTAFNIFLK